MGIVELNVGGNFVFVFYDFLIFYVIEFSKSFGVMWNFGLMYIIFFVFVKLFFVEIL